MTQTLRFGLRSQAGILRPAARWLGPASAADRLVLDRAVGPVLDVGCGPGRHALALAERGIPTLGLDVTLHAIAIARARGVPVLERSVFARVPMVGRWRTALLLDGNIGIGADPVVLLQRVGRLLAADGRVLAELDPPDWPCSPQTVRLEIAGATGPWFRWVSVSVDRIESVASQSGLALCDVFTLDNERWFAELRGD